jgi:glutathione-regulated potassium-efflux system ancillary protein KefG
MVIDSAKLPSNLNPADLVGAAEASRILGLSHATSVTTYLRRYPDFPKPVVDVSSSHARLWNRKDIERWHRERGKHDAG